MVFLEDEVMRMYNEGYTQKEIQKSFGLTRNEFYKIYLKLKSAGLITPRFHRQKKKKKKVKNYSFDHLSGVYNVRKNNKYYVCVKTEEQAKRVVELLKECDWDYNQRHEIKKRVLSGG